MRTYTTANRKPPPPIRFSLDGREMDFTTPSFAPMLFMVGGASGDQQAQIKTMRDFLDWFGAGLSEEDGEWVLAKLLDPSDPLEVTDVIEIINDLIEDIAARPTTPSTDLSVSLGQTPSTVGRQPETSTPPNSVFADSVT